MKRKLIALIVMSAITCNLLSGCGNTDNGESEIESKDSDASESASEASWTPIENFPEAIKG
ncbi:hypothetical protein [Butyrivibrio sp. AE3004]|uniref:hypothetical protein n=1 Tax=Butyrivibrio sp. AE3004 TaxID=1506994 RepID=UPI000494455A|nr:hypothetical protein [Butyrivibrio sp. AE3004]